jgi:hypothetical protein
VDPVELKVQPPYVDLAVSNKDINAVNISMDHTTRVHFNDKIVAFGGIEEQLQYIGTLDPSKLLIQNLLNNLEQSIQPVRLQLERKFIKVIFICKLILSNGVIVDSEAVQSSTFLLIVLLSFNNFL